jgi:hypothetical protein
MSNNFKEIYTWEIMGIEMGEWLGISDSHEDDFRM